MEGRGRAGLPMQINLPSPQLSRWNKMGLFWIKIGCVVRYYIYVYVCTNHQVTGADTGFSEGGGGVMATRGGG